MSVSEAYGRALGSVGPAMLGVLRGMEQALRYLHPPAIPKLRDKLAPMAERLDERRAAFAAVEIPEGIEELHAHLCRAAETTSNAVRLFLEPAEAPEAAPRILAAMREHARAQEALYPLRGIAPPFAAFFSEDEAAADLDPEPPQGVSVGLHASRPPEEGEPRGGFHLYVPETYDGSEAWPLVVALHGGSGSGREFLWTWLREARSRRLLLLAPTSRGPTWSFQGPDLDAPALRAMVEHVSAHWKVDPARILLTGLSDGATYTLYSGLGADSPATALAPVSGVLHPLALHGENRDRARGRRIYLVHGALDWMFPVALARLAHEDLVGAGAEVVYREIEDLSHTYPREENARILDWFLAG